MNGTVYYKESEDLEKMVDSMDKLSYVEMAGIPIPIKSIKAKSVIELRKTQNVLLKIEIPFRGA